MAGEAERITFICLECKRIIIGDFYVAKANRQKVIFCSLACVNAARTAGKILPDPMEEFSKERAERGATMK